MRSTTSPDTRRAPAAPLRTALLAAAALLLALAAIPPAHAQGEDGPARSLLLRVTDEAGAPLAAVKVDVTVALEGAAGTSPHDGREAAFHHEAAVPLSWRGEGTLRLPASIQGRAVVTVHARRLPAALAQRLGQGARSAPTATTIGPGTNGPLVLALAPTGGVRVHVVDARGDDVRGAEVRLDLEGSYLAHAEKTNPSGTARFSGDAVAVGAALLEVKDPRSAARVRRRIALEGAPHEITVALPRQPPSATLALKIIDEHGRPLAYRGPMEVRSFDDGALVFRSPACLEGAGPASGESRLLSIAVAPGRYEVFLETLGALLPAKRLGVRSGDLADVKIEPPVPGAIIVRAARDPAVPAIEVMAGVEHGQGGRRSLKAGGACAVLGLGRAVVEARAPGRAPFVRRYDLAPGVTLAADVALAPEATLLVRVEDATGRPLLADALGLRPITLEFGAGEDARLLTCPFGAATREDGTFEPSPLPPDRARFLGLPAGPATVSLPGAAARVTLEAGRASEVTLRLSCTLTAIAGAQEEELRRRVASDRLSGTDAPASALVLVRDEQGSPVAEGVAVARLLGPSGAAAAGAPRLARTSSGVGLLELHEGRWEISGGSPLRPEGAPVTITLAPFDRRLVQVVPAPASAAAFVLVARAETALERGAPARSGALRRGCVRVARASDGALLAVEAPLSREAALLGPLPAGVPLRIMALGEEAAIEGAGAPAPGPSGAGPAVEVTLAPGETRPLLLAPAAEAVLALEEAAAAPIADVRLLAPRRARGPLERLSREGVTLTAKVAPVPSQALVRFLGDPLDLARAVLPLSPGAGETVRLAPRPARGTSAISGIIVLPAGAGADGRRALLRGPGAALLLESGAPFRAEGLPAGTWVLEASGEALRSFDLEEGKERALGVLLLP